jgi:SAM-dependent methyltransferase
MIVSSLLNLGCGKRYHKDWTNVDFISNNDNVVAANLLKGIPFPDCSYDVVYHSHLLEHLPKENSLKFVKECFRVLKPGGIIRIVVPDFENMVNEYIRVLNCLDNKSEIEEANYEWILLEILDQMVRTRSGGEMITYLAQEQVINESYVYSRVGDEMKELREILIDKNDSEKRGVKWFFRFDEFKVGSFRLGGEVHQWMYDRYSLKKLLRKSGFENIETMGASKSNIINWNWYELDIKDGVVHKPNSLFVEASKPFQL